MTFETVNSRSGHIIPIVNGYHVHSVYNPIKEAKTFIEANLAKIAGEKNFLIFGAGFGYHINELISYLQANQRENFKVYVVEPNENLRDYCIKNNSHPDNVKFLLDCEPSEAFQNYEFVNFLSNKPALLTHQASFNLSKDYFEKFLRFKSSRNVQDIIPHVIDEKFQKALSTFENKTIDEAISEMNDIRSIDLSSLLITTFSKIAGAREDNV